jgi:hypothetical protein
LEKLRVRHAAKAAASCDNDGAQIIGDDFEGSWYWLRSPQQKKRVVISLYNRY